MHARMLLGPLLISALTWGCDEGPRAPDGGQAGDGGARGPADSGASVIGTAGCGAPLTIATGEWVAESVDVAGGARDYWVWLPEGYDSDRAYPVVYQLHGCSSSETREDNNVPVQNVSGSEAIHIRARAAASCWDTATDGPDVPYFDALVPAVEAAWCADPARRFASGYSSGAFMAHRLACIRGDVLHAVATIAGGQGGASCTGDVAALLIHDADDETVDISASEQARDDHAIRNGCDLAGARAPIEPAPCEAFAGCDQPVVWCQTAGEDHSRQDTLAATAFWTFFSSLPR